ncbi:disease resistance protein Pik-2-like [Triticum dicoccoides]|uniref:disease resistance protein Pik-2-like n=1 Tax=Triticum dicoccoides TaxID=85692 RepID=UPI000E7A2F67|nr:disease resistance protein Pik-2-like [Triticum dicoccoides]
MEATGLSIGKSVLSGALSYAKSAMAEEVALQLGVQRDHVFITDELEMMQSFLMAAHDDRDDNMVVRTWVKQVRNVSYNVEDCLQDFAVRLEKQSWWRIPRTVRARRHVAKQMKDLRVKVEDVSQRNQRYHLIKGSSSKPTSAVGQATISSRLTLSADDEARWQHNRAKMDLVGLINNNDDDLAVIAVWETSTDDLGDMQSIVRSVYEDPKIRKKFECHAWIRFMLPFNPIDFIQSILKQFYVNCLLEAREEEKVGRWAQILKLMGTPNNDDLPHEFRTYLNEKSYLIVLEDVHTIEEWNYITTWFPRNKKGSRILVSTKDVKVANLCIGDDNGAPEHKQLLDNHTVHAFYKKGFQDGKISEEAGFSSDIISEDTDSSRHMEVQGFDSLEESQLIGRESEKEKIIQLFSHNSEQQVKVISLWGMGGVGKTTLVRDMYQRKEISGMFEKRACVTVMHPFNCIDLLQSLVVQLRDKKEETDLATCLKQKRYFLIIDDLSSTTEWDAIKVHLPEIAGSCIIITTREKNIAEHCSKVETDYIIQLNNLSPDDACILFTKKVFEKTINLDEQYPDLVEQAKLILRKCGGLPLALITIGGFLAKQPKTAFEWRKLNEHISAELEMNPNLETIKAVLMKSYDGLPYYLKACFLYLAIFPEGQQIARRRLVHRWLAEGYSREVRGKSVEEVLDSYFTELISRSMILPSQQSIYSRKGIDSCHVHDLIREIAISKSMEENLVFTLEEGCSLSNQGTVRHLVVSSNWKGDQCEFENVVDLFHVRSLTVFGNWRPFYISDKMRLLRVLDLEGKWDLVDHHLKHIGKLIHLRYLSIRGHAEIFHLPNSLGNLKQLQTLDISGTGIIKLPRTIIKLVNMQHILASDIGKATRGTFEDADEQSLMSLPVQSLYCCLPCCAPNILEDELELDDGALKRHDVCTTYCCSILPYCAAGRNQGGVEAPRWIWKLKALHTLRTVDISVGKTVLQDIKRLTRLRKLGLAGINKRNSQELCSAIACLNSLVSLSLQSHGETGLSGCLDGLSSPPENLQSLKLRGNLVKLPEWIQGLKNLVKLKLEWSRILEHDAAIQVLGNLPNLATLRLLYDSFVGEEVRLSFPSESFPSLKVLQLKFKQKLKLVEFEEGAVPKLEFLQYIHGISGMDCSLDYDISEA